MSRENCFEVYVIGGKSYCNYYDWGCLLCSEVKKCPEGLDDEDSDDNWFSEEDICPACNGSGESDTVFSDEHSPVCSLCKGSGIEPDKQ